MMLLGAASDVEVVAVGAVAIGLVVNPRYASFFLIPLEGTSEAGAENCTRGKTTRTRNRFMCFE